MKKILKFILHKTGYQISRIHTSDFIRRMKIINHCNIDTLLDVGANDGKYATDMREIGYRKRIISFEPLKSAFEGLKKASSNDDNWIINNYALGDSDTKGIINVAGNSVSSSILNILPIHLKNAPESKYIGHEDIEIKKLDSIFYTFCNINDNIMLKIDTQGFEKRVLDGAIESLRSIKIIQLEMSIVSLYENEMLFKEMINYLDIKGFQLASLENGFADLTTGQLLQVDGIFVQKKFI